MSVATTRDDFFPEDLCGCSALTAGTSQLVDVVLEQGGVDKIARRYSMQTVDALESALSYCVWSRCPAHGSASDVVSELRVVQNESEAEMEASERALEQSRERRASMGVWDEVLAENESDAREQAGAL